MLNHQPAQSEPQSQLDLRTMPKLRLRLPTVGQNVLNLLDKDTPLSIYQLGDEAKQQQLRLKNKIFLYQESAEICQEATQDLLREL